MTSEYKQLSVLELCREKVFYVGNDRKLSVIALCVFDIGQIYHHIVHKLSFTQKLVHDIVFSFGSSAFASFSLKN
jgi:hypothetical protein